MLIRAEDAKQICSLLQLVPAKLPGIFPSRGSNSCGRGRIQHPEPSCTNDNILAMFILLLQGGIFVFLSVFGALKHMFTFVMSKVSSTGVGEPPALV